MKMSPFESILRALSSGYIYINVPMYISSKVRPGFDENVTIRKHSSSAFYRLHYTKIRPELWKIWPSEHDVSEFLKDGHNHFFFFTSHTSCSDAHIFQSIRRILMKMEPIERIRRELSTGYIYTKIRPELRKIWASEHNVCEFLKDVTNPFFFFTSHIRCYQIFVACLECFSAILCSPGYQSSLYMQAKIQKLMDSVEEMLCENSENGESVME